MPVGFIFDMLGQIDVECALRWARSVSSFLRQQPHPLGFLTFFFAQEVRRIGIASGVGYVSLADSSNCTESKESEDGVDLQ